STEQKISRLIKCNCRLPQPVSLDLPVGIFNALILPITLLQLHDNPLVNMFDVISNHSLDIDFAYLGKAFFDANRDCNFSQLPQPFGFKGELPKGTKKHPSEAASGKPRGHAEMLDNLGMLGLSKGDIFVSDSWLATFSAVKEFRRQHGLTETTLPHEKVNHSAGEIKNSNGYSTNAIEAKGSLLKRWARRKLGGKLPSHSDRVKRHRLINEYPGRCILKRLPDSGD
ncbi:NEK5, partial [Symbiodinium microadriaticum]